MDAEFEEYYMWVCYSLDNMNVDHELASIDSIERAFDKNVEANITQRQMCIRDSACIEAERIRARANLQGDWD